jgi:hypothetical protein
MQLKCLHLDSPRLVLLNVTDRKPTTSIFLGATVSEAPPNLRGIITVLAFRRMGLSRQIRKYWGCSTRANELKEAMAELIHHPNPGKTGVDWGPWLRSE